MEFIIEFISTANLPLLYILIVAFLATLIENLLPPAPGDSLVLFLGALIGLGKVDFYSLLLVSTIGSTVGFAAMFLLGRYFGHKIIDSNRFKFINEESMHKPREWFRKYGYSIVVLNRFLSGTRAVISFVAGASELKFRYTIIYAAISSLIWNGLLIYFGMLFGSNWRLVDKYISLYGYIFIPIFALVAIYFGYKFYKSHKDKSKA